ncbi:hypothetical protein cco105_09810, partial [Campylobacter coli 2548]
MTSRTKKNALLNFCNDLRIAVSAGNFIAFHIYSFSSVI